jgi:hypothetical protein
MSMMGSSVLDNNVEVYNGPGGVIIVDAMPYSTDIGYAELRLEGCTFNGNYPASLPVLVADNRGTEAKAVIYSDSAAPAVCTYEWPEFTSDITLPCENSSSPEPLGKAGANFLTAADAWLLEVKQVRSACAVGCSAH